jgi:predicted methyltransferase
MQKDEIIKLINTYWKFDNDQDTTSTWHDKQDLINEIEQLTLTDVVKSFCKYCNNELCDSQKFNSTCFNCGKKPI